MKRSSNRRDRVKYVDPVTGLTEYRYVEKVTYRYEDEEKAKAYDKMIDMAEERFNIPIRNNLAPNSKSATGRVSKDRNWHSYRTVWL